MILHTIFAYLVLECLFNLYASGVGNSNKDEIPFSIEGFNCISNVSILSIQQNFNKIFLYLILKLSFNESFSMRANYYAVI